MNHQLTFEYRCLYGISNLLTVCRCPLKQKDILKKLISPGNWFLFQTSYVILCVRVYKAVCVSLPCFCCQIGMVLGYNLFLDVKSELSC